MAVSNNAGIFDATCLNDDALLHLSADQRPTLCSPLSVSVCCYQIFRYQICVIRFGHKCGQINSLILDIPTTAFINVTTT